MYSWQEFGLLKFYTASVPLALEWILIKQLCGPVYRPGDGKQAVSSPHTAGFHRYWC